MPFIVRIFAVSVLVVSVTVPAAMAADPCTARPSPAEQLVFQDRVLVIAHRGNSSQAPENTLPAFQSALQSRADLVELDYYHSADGVPIVFHDRKLDRTTDAIARWGCKGLHVEDFTYCQLQCLDAGRWFGRQFAGARIPTLSESLRLIQSGSMTLIERKGGDAGTCIAMLRQRGLTRRVVVQSFDWDYVRDCHRLAPELTLAALGDKEVTAEQLDQIATTGAQVVGWNHEYIQPEQVEAIHARGWRVWVYTVNELDRAQMLVASGVDGLISDHPEMMLKWLESQGLRPGDAASPR